MPNGHLTHYPITFHGPCGSQRIRFRGLSVRTAAESVQQPPNMQTLSGVGVIPNDAQVRELQTANQAHRAFLFCLPAQPDVAIIAYLDQVQDVAADCILSDSARRMANVVLANPETFALDNPPTLEVQLQESPDCPSAQSNCLGPVAAAIMIAILAIVASVLQSPVGRNQATTLSRSEAQLSTGPLAGVDQAVGPGAFTNSNPYPASPGSLTLNNCVWSTTCPPDCPPPISCPGHGPIRAVCNPNTGERYFYTPGHPLYNAAHVGESLADGYFCTDSDARLAGFQPAP